MTPTLLYCASKAASELKDQLGGLPLDLHVAHDRASALALVEQHRPALVLATLEREPLSLRHALHGADLVILGPDNPELVRRTLRAGAADWLTLPIRRSDGTRMLSAHLKRKERRSSAALLTASTTLDAVSVVVRRLEPGPTREELSLLLRYGRVLLRQDARLGSVVAAAASAAQLVEAKTPLRVSIQSDPDLPPVPMSTSELGRGLLEMMLSAADQGAQRAQLTAIRLRDTVQIDLSNDAPLAVSSRFSVGSLRGRVEDLGGNVELTSTSGTGFQVQISLPAADSA